MRTLIIGSGNMGRGIATRLLAGGNDVTLHDVDPQVATRLAADLAPSASGTAKIGVTASPADAAASSDVVVLASWFRANLEVARQLAPALDGKIVVDISNPLNEGYDGLVTEPGTSAAETIRAVLRPRTRVIKAFNTTFAGTLVPGQVNGHPLDVFIAGDDADAKNVVASLVRSGGLNVIDVGDLSRARLLEAMALLGITLQSRLGTGFMSGWKFVMPAAADARAA